MEKEERKSVAIIVTHPDEETLWAGGTILSHPEWSFFVVCLSNGNNPELAPRFYNALKLLKSEGVMGNFNYKSCQVQKHKNELERTIIQLLPDTHFDIVISHNSFSESSNDYIHEAVNESIIKLRQEGFISANEIWTFAYDDGSLKYYSDSNEERPQVLQKLSKKVWSQKHKIITRIFGFDEKSWEAKTTPLTEAFWKHEDSINPKKEKRSKPFGYGLNIFRSPNIEALKFLYHKSIEYVYEQNYWKFDDVDENAEIIEPEFENRNRYSYKKIGKELNIFKSASIDNLKSLYYKSMSFLFDRSSWKTDSYSDFSFNEYESKSERKSRIRKIGKELKIFKAPSIDTLKTLYNNSLSFAFERNKLEPDFATCGEENKDMSLFEDTSIESLKRKYNSKRLE